MGEPPASELRLALPLIESSFNPLVWSVHELCRAKALLHELPLAHAMLQAVHEATRLERLSLLTRGGPQELQVLTTLPALKELWVTFEFCVAEAQQEARFTWLREHLPQLERLERGQLE